MSKNKDLTKYRVLILERLFYEMRELTIKQIQNILEKRYDITANKKTLYDDIAVLTRFENIQIIRKRKKVYYFLEVEE